MLLEEVLSDLKANANEQNKKVFLKHGAREPFYGVLTEHLKKLQKKIKKDHELALKLYATGISDAMYLAGLICDPLRFTKKELNDWADKAYWYMISEYTVAFVAAETIFAKEIALEWIKSEKENVASAGWATLSAILKNNPGKLDKKEITGLLESIPQAIHSERNRVRYTMNGFVIASGAFVPELTGNALNIASKVGKVKVDMGGTACKVPDAKEYIAKIQKRNEGKK